MLPSFHRFFSEYGSHPCLRRDAESVKATFHKGMLEIRIPKVEPRPAAKIAIETV